MGEWDDEHTPPVPAAIGTNSDAWCRIEDSPMCLSIRVWTGFGPHDLGYHTGTGTLNIEFDDVCWWFTALASLFESFHGPCNPFQDVPLNPLYFL